jgi:hypothetical protein
MPLALHAADHQIFEVSDMAGSHEDLFRGDHGSGYRHAPILIHKQFEPFVLYSSLKPRAQGSKIQITAYSAVNLKRWPKETTSFSQIGKKLVLIDACQTPISRSLLIDALLLSNVHPEH